MALVTDREAPADVPTTNVLRDLEDPYAVVPAEMRLGPNVLLMIDNPPQLGETRDIVIRVRCNAIGDEQRKVDGEKTHFCRNTIVTAWLLGQPTPPSADEPQPALFDDDGDPSTEATGGDGQDGEPEPVGELIGGLAEFAGRPEFSDAGK